jgi:hypothetical protein
MTIKLTKKELAKLKICEDAGKLAKSINRSVSIRQTKIAKLERETFIKECVKHGLPKPTPEYKFHPKRRWKFDWAWEGLWRDNGWFQIALEIEGGIWSDGRHTRGSGFAEDISKYNEAVIHGWSLLRCSRQDFNNGCGTDSLWRLLRIMFGLKVD